MAIAINNNHKDIVNLIVSRDNYDPTIPDKDGWTGLHYLCAAGYTNLVKTLLEKHSDIDINKQTECGYTCMSLAASNERKNIVDLIADMDNYDPTIPPKDGWTDLHNLCYYGYIDVYNALIKKHPEFDIDQKTVDGKSCRMLVEKYSNSKR